MNVTDVKSQCGICKNTCPENVTCNDRRNVHTNHHFELEVYFAHSSTFPETQKATIVPCVT